MVTDILFSLILIASLVNGICLIKESKVKRGIRSLLSGISLLVITILYGLIRSDYGYSGSIFNFLLYHLDFLELSSILLFSYILIGSFNFYNLVILVRDKKRKALSVADQVNSLKFKCQGLYDLDSYSERAREFKIPKNSCFVNSQLALHFRSKIRYDELDKELKSLYVMNLLLHDGAKNKKIYFF